MGSEEGKSNLDLHEKIFNIYKDFMARVTKFEELVAVGSRLLVGFQQGLEFLRRPPIDNTSGLIKSVIKANQTKRIQSYLEAGCRNTHDGVQNVSKWIYFSLHFDPHPPSLLNVYGKLIFGPLFSCNPTFLSLTSLTAFAFLMHGKHLCQEVHTCQLGLQDYLSEVMGATGRSILNQLEFLMEDVTNAMQSAMGNSPLSEDEDFDTGINEQATRDDEEGSAPSHIKRYDVTDFAVLMGAIYSMVKKEYVMQEKIVSSLNLKSSSGELESYCLMWSLRPLINDDIMHQAWKLIP
ncbi:hypothetical protein FEM48_Zijuj08G0137600 [Ziziphus jujuba var. spinosa]|uniref:DUF7795 domain-containing protein n=1 Tax=Ziziphus jujuba var. spinosa TaxID=714518 RepID=A0A978UZG2_ZIZJJ|nr:hypothetical protein FEM48_Zijuj08G0137600 [Ziziphus jujuba var. spinosa]